MVAVDRVVVVGFDVVGGSAGEAVVVEVLDGASVGGGVVLPLLVAVVEVDDVVVY